MNDILQLFNFLSSNSENERKQAYDTLEELFQDPTLYNILFEILQTPNLESKYYILTANCLLTWFRRNIIDVNIQPTFIQQLQSLLLINHPAQKELFSLYNRLTCYCDRYIDLFITFLGNSIDLFTINTQPEILVCVLKLGWITSKEFANVLDKKIKSYIIQLFTEINNRLIPILQNTKQFLTFSTGYTIIRYAYKVFFYTTKVKQSQINEELLPLIFNSLHLILHNIPSISDRNFYLLVRFCSKILTNLRNTSFNTIYKKLNMTNEQINSIENDIDLLTLQFSIALAPFHVDAINSFLNLLYNHLQIASESPEFVQFLLCGSLLTENDLSDFLINPGVFYEYAYSGIQNSNPRKTIYNIANKKSFMSQTGEIIRNIISLPPTEPSMYLISSIIHASNTLEMGNEVFQWILECFTKRIPFQSSLEMSTFFYLISKSYPRIVPKEFIVELVPIVYNVIMLSVLNNSDEQSFFYECSRCLVTVTNAVRAARKMIKNGIEFPPDLFICIVQLLPSLLTSDAAQFVEIYISDSIYDESKKQFVQSQLETAKKNICLLASSALSSAVDYLNRSDLESFRNNKELDDFVIVSQSLKTINEILLCEGQTPTISNEILLLIQILMENYNRHFSDDLFALIITIFNSGFPDSKFIVSMIIECINNIYGMIDEIDELFLIFVYFLNLFPDDFVQMNFAPYLTEIGIKACESTFIKEGTLLICFSIQADTNFDISHVYEYVNNRCLKEYGFFNNFGILILMSIIVSRPQINIPKEELLSSIFKWVVEDNAKSPDVKRLSALALMVLSNCDDVMKVAIELLYQEKKQRELLLIAADPTDHPYPSPIEKYNVIGIAQNSLQNCSEENKQIFMNSILQIFSSNIV